MNSCRTAFVLAALFLFGADTAVASNGSGGGVGAALLELIGLGLSFGCLLVSWKVLSFVRGGRLAAPWQMFTTAFFLFTAGQVLALLSYLSMPSAAGDVVIYLRILGFLILFLGIIKMRKVLA